MCQSLEKSGEREKVADGKEWLRGKKWVREKSFGGEKVPQRKKALTQVTIQSTGSSKFSFWGQTEPRRLVCEERNS